MRLCCVIGAVIGVLVEPSALASVSFVAPRTTASATRGSRWDGCHRSSRTPSMTSLRTVGRNPRRLIVDTDLGLDDLVALAILRVQQCLNRDGGRGEYTNFRLHGVTLSPGISRASSENAALLRRLLPPNTPVYVGEDAIKYREEDKPAWWDRTAGQVSSFLESLPPATNDGGVRGSDEITNISAEQFIADNVDDPDVDILCMAPLSTVARALRLRRTRTTGVFSPGANFYIMGGIRSDSKATKRGEPTSPLGYNDCEGQKEFGEFNFALDIEAAREMLSSVSSARIIPLEACTLVPNSLRSEPPLVTLPSMLNDVPQILALSIDGTRRNNDLDPATDELTAAQNILLGLLREFGTKETQWDSIAAAIYCNALDSNANGGGVESLAQKIDPGELELSELGALTFPGCGRDADGVMRDDDDRSEHDRSSLGREVHHVYPTFTTEDESRFFRYLVSLLSPR